MKNKNGQDFEELKRLSDENKRLRREISLLKRELDEARGTSIFKHGHDYGNPTFERQAYLEQQYSKKSFSSSVVLRAKQTSVFKVYRRILNFIRRYTFITMTLRIASFLFAFIETGALLLLSTSALVISIPISLTISHISVLLTVFSAQKRNRKNKTVIEGKNVFLLFPPKARAFDKDSYFRFMVCELAKDENNTVVIVSPSPIKTLGISDSKKPYLLSRYETDNVIMVRRHYYFTLRKRVINKYAKNITEIF